jgi:hypothetical protein
MIPYILAAVGGYLIGDSLKGKQYAKGGGVSQDKFKYVEWSGSEENDGYIYGINYIDAETGDAIDAEWFKTKEERENSIKEKIRKKIAELKIEDIIIRLKELDVDGETMQYILEEVGMSDQMLRQLVMTANNQELQELMAEKKELEK